MYEMTRPTKQAWINSASSNRSAASAGSSGDGNHHHGQANGSATNGVSQSPAIGPMQRPTSTVTSGSLLRHNHNNHPRVILAQRGINMSKSSDLARQQQGGGQPQQVNSIGVVRSSQSNKRPSSGGSGSLVPYADGDSSDSEDGGSSSARRTAEENKMNGLARQGSFGAGSVKPSFVPRAVAMNSLAKRANGVGGENHHHQINGPSPSPRPGTPASHFGSNGRSSNGGSGGDFGLQQQQLPDRPPSAASSTCSNSSVTKSSRSGTWTVTDNDRHTPSVNSDNSTGSTSGGWKVTPTNSQEDQHQEHPPPRAVVSREPFRPDAASASSSLPSTAPSSLASTPERRVKRGSSMEEYEAELDRGRSKKVKKRHSDATNGGGGDGGGGRPCFNASHQNPFQNFQSRAYNSNGGGGGGQSSYSSTWGGSSNNGSSSGWNGGGHHRDHSYHANRRNSNGGGGGGGGYRRSQSSSSLYGNGGGGGGGAAEYYRDNRGRSRDRFWHQGGGGGRSGGGGGGDFRDYGYHRNHRR